MSCRGQVDGRASAQQTDNHRQTVRSGSGRQCRRTCHSRLLLLLKSCSSTSRSGVSQRARLQRFVNQMMRKKREEWMMNRKRKRRDQIWLRDQRVQRGHGR